MTIEDLIKILQKQEEKNITLELEGIIITKILIEKMKISLKKHNLFFESKIERKTKLGINLNQLMKISKIKDNEILLEFDQLQSLKISY